MIKTLTNQTIALAGLSQAVYLVQSIAKTGSANEEDLETCIASILKINADDVPNVYGGLEKLKTGLKLLENQLGRPEKVDTELARYAAALVYLEGKYRRNIPMQNALRSGIEKATAQAAHFGVSHENVLANLADLYQNTISQLRPRILVVGEPVHLTDSLNANKIRALLLAGLRSAWLWRQCGGGRWKFLLYREKLRAEAVSLLKSHFSDLSHI
ncbi:MAG: high frequency lysogenization protein HflD [Methylococcaceae bacterium]|nr:high frequency lysogenization protein HflD [Methylococcaceae bacterium]